MLHILLASAIVTSSRNPIVQVETELRGKGFTQAQVHDIFSDKRLKVYTQKAIASKPVNWSAYQAQVLKKASVAKGVAFITAHLVDFTRAESKYGVPKETIAAVMRIETDFGTYTGTSIVPDVFYSFLYHEKRVVWATDNLVETLVYARREGIDPFTLKGSYDGAIGYPQFLPSTIMSLGVDGNADGRVNMFDIADAAPSLANFLAQNGFAKSQKGALTAYYGSSVGYPTVVMKYAAALKTALPAKK